MWTSILINIFFIGRIFLFEEEFNKNDNNKMFVEEYEKYKWSYSFDLIGIHINRKVDPVESGDSSFAELIICVDKMVNIFNNKQIFAAYCFCNLDSINMCADSVNFEDLVSKGCSSDTTYFSNYSMTLKGAPDIIGNYIAIGKVYIPKVCWSCNRDEYWMFPFQFNFRVE